MDETNSCQGTCGWMCYVRAWQRLNELLHNSLCDLRQRQALIRGASVYWIINSLSHWFSLQKKWGETTSKPVLKESGRKRIKRRVKSKMTSLLQTVKMLSLQIITKTINIINNRHLWGKNDNHTMRLSHNWNFIFHRVALYHTMWYKHNSHGWAFISHKVNLIIASSLLLLIITLFHKTWLLSYNFVAFSSNKSMGSVRLLFKIKKN